MSADGDTTAAMLCTWELLFSVLGPTAAGAASLVLQHLRVVDRAGELHDLGVIIAPLPRLADHARIQVDTGVAILVRTANGTPWGPDVDALNILSLEKDAT